MIKKCAVLANLSQTIIRKVWIQQKLKPTAEEIQFSVKEMIHIFEKTLTRDREERSLLPKNLTKDIIQIMINNVKIEYRCKDKIEAFSPRMIPSILNDMIKGEAIFEVLNSYDEAMMLQ